MSARLRIPYGLTLIGVLGIAAAPAGAQTQTFADVQAGLGYSTNPEMRLDGVGSGFGRVSVFGFHGWGTERSSTNISAYVENSTYFRRYSNKQLFDLNAATTRQVSEKVRLFGNLGFSGDFGAQLSSRFYGAPVGTVTVDPTFADNSVIVVNPDLAALNQRQYRINAQTGASLVLSPRDSLNTTLGAQRVFFSGDSDVLNYNLYDATAGYQRQLDERISIGLRAIASYADYRLGRSILSYGPQVTGSIRLAENLQASGAIGLVRTEQDTGTVGGRDNSIDLAFDGSLCRTLASERMCARASRRTQSSVLGTAPTSSSINVDYSRRLNARDQLQASFAVVTTGAERELGFGRRTFYTVAGSFDRKMSDRVSAGVNLAARRLNTVGPDPKEDLGGSLFIRTRFGSVR